MYAGIAVASKHIMPSTAGFDISICAFTGHATCCTSAPNRALTESALVAMESWLRIQDHTAWLALLTFSRPWPKDDSRKADHTAGAAVE